MTFTAATLLLSLLAPQDEPEALFKRLEEGSPSVRSVVESRLVDFGPALIPQVKVRMVAASGEIWSSLDRVLQRIETAERRRRFRATAAKVSLRADKRPFPDLLPELERMLGVPLGKHDSLKLPVTVEVMDVSPLEVLDRACASAKIVWHAQWTYGSPDIVPKLVFRGVTELPESRPVKYVKGFRIGPAGIEVQRRRTPFADESKAYISLTIQPPPGVGQVMLDEIRIERVLDDRGGVLHESPEPKKIQSRPQRLAGAASPLGHISWVMGIHTPAPEATAFSLLGAVARIRGEVARKYVALEASEAALGRSVKFEGLTLTLESFHKGEGKLVVGVTQKGRRVHPEPTDDEFVVDGNRLEFAVLRMRDGSTLHAQRVDRHFGPDGRVEHTFLTTAEPVEIRFVTYTMWERESLEFEFKEVPIPGGGR